MNCNFSNTGKSTFRGKSYILLTVHLIQSMKSHFYKAHKFEQQALFLLN